MRGRRGEVVPKDYENVIKWKYQLVILIKVPLRGDLGVCFLLSITVQIQGDSSSLRSSERRHFGSGGRLRADTLVSPLDYRHGYRVESPALPPI